MTQPGWYPDPQGPGDQLRWFDGARWTESVISQKSVSAQRTKERAAKGIGIMLAVLAVLIVGGSIAYFIYFIFLIRAM